ncbi:hypothetical protein OROHE_003168 [Orobanche hederae]
MEVGREVRLGLVLSDRSHAMHKEVVDVPETTHSWKEHWFFIGGNWWSPNDEYEPNILYGRLRAIENFISKIRHIPAREMSLDFDDRVEKLLELSPEQRKSHLLTTEENLWAAVSRIRAASGRRETPAQRVKWLAVEAAERRRLGASKRKRPVIEPEASVNKIEVVHDLEVLHTPSPMRIGRAVRKEALVER